MKIVSIALSLSFILPTVTFAAYPTSPPSDFIMTCHDKRCIATGAVPSHEGGTLANMIDLTYFSNDNKTTWKIYANDTWDQLMNDFGEWKNLICNQNLQRCVLTGWYRSSRVVSVRLRSTQDGGKHWRKIRVNPSACVLSSDTGIGFTDVLCATSFRNCVIVGTCGTGLYTHTAFGLASPNGGEDWHFSKIKDPVPESFAKLTCDDNVKVCNTANGYVTYDGGDTWQLK